MAEQYDHIAEEYQKAKGLSVFRVIEYSLFRQLGDLSGQAVLDLACGEGFNTRKLKQEGAERVVGVDISKEMVRLAQEQEAKEPLGIEYIHDSVQTMGKIGEFDLVTAVFLLNYAPTREDLLQMCQTAYDNLKPGQRFVAINDNAGEGARRPDAFKPYGFSYVPPETFEEGALINLTLDMGYDQLQLDFNYLSRDSYNWALTTAGFKLVEWHKLSLPPDVAEQDSPGYWDFFFEISPVIMIECQK